MINIKLNENKIQLANTCSLQEILNQQKFNEKYYAIFLNTKFVPRIEHAATILKDGDVIELISPMQGG